MILFVGLSTVFFMIYQISSSYIPEGVSCSPREAKSWRGRWTHLRHRRRLRVWSACPLFMRLAICKVVDFGLDRGWDLCLGEFLVKWGEFSIWQVSKPPKHLFNILAVAWISVWWSFHCMFFSIVLIYRKRWMMPAWRYCLQWSCQLCSGSSLSGRMFENLLLSWHK